MVDAGAIRRRFKLIEKHLDERMRRLVAAAEAVGTGGVSLVARAPRVSRQAIRVGAQELKARGPQRLAGGRIPPPGRGDTAKPNGQPRRCLSLAQIHAALAHYYDHQATLDAEIAQQEQTVRRLRREAGDSPLGVRLKALGLLS
jgi:hypothetical protein